MTINLCGVPYEIRMIEDSFNMENQFGEIKFLEGVIRINGKLSAALIEQTIWHEAIHGIFELIGRGDLSEDEVLVSNLAIALNQLADIRDMRV